MHDQDSRVFLESRPELDESNSPSSNGDPHRDLDPNSGDGWQVNWDLGERPIRNSFASLDDDPILQWILRRQKVNVDTEKRRVWIFERARRQVFHQRR